MVERASVDEPVEVLKPPRRVADVEVVLLQPSQIPAVGLAQESGRLPKQPPLAVSIR